MKRLVVAVAAGWAIMLSALPALAQQAGNTAPPDYGYYRYMHMWGGGFFMPLLWIIVFFILMALFSRFGLWGRHHYRYRHAGSALDILEERFARGEIDKAEFEEKRRTLGR